MPVSCSFLPTKLLCCTPAYFLHNEIGILQFWSLRDCSSSFPLYTAWKLPITQCFTARLMGKKEQYVLNLMVHWSYIFHHCPSTGCWWFTCFSRLTEIFVVDSASVCTLTVCLFLFFFWSIWSGAKSCSWQESPTLKHTRTMHKETIHFKELNFLYQRITSLFGVRTLVCKYFN